MMDELRPDGAEWDQDDNGRLTPWGARVAGLARQFDYPPAPDFTLARGISAGQAKRTRPFLQPAWAVALLVAAIALTVLAVPQVRAAVVRIFQLGVVRIFVTEPSPQVTGAPVPTPDSMGTGQPALAQQAPVTATPGVQRPPTPLPSLSEIATATFRAKEARLPAALAGLAGQTTLGEARTRVPFPIALPTYPADLGPPDYVFVQEHAAPVVILAWRDPEAKGSVKLSLWVFLNGTAIDKIQPETVQETTVDSRRALWTQGEHMLFMRNGDVTVRHLVLGNTLIWERKDITFRLETSLPLEEAVKVAESVR